MNEPQHNDTPKKTRSASENWCKHDIDSRLVPAMQVFLLKTGADGYGFFWAVVEEMYRTNKPEQATTTLFTLAEILSVEPVRMAKIVDIAITSGLWTRTDDGVFSPRVDREISSRKENLQHISEIRAEAGRESGRTRRNKREQNEPEEIRLEEIRVEENRINTNTLTTPKILVGEYVHLTQAEIDKLKDKFGTVFYDRLIEKLDAWIAQDPKPSRIKNGKNAAATFRAWVISAVAEEQQRARGGSAVGQKLTPAEQSMRTLQTIIEKEAQSHE